LPVARCGHRRCEIGKWVDEKNIEIGKRTTGSRKLPPPKLGPCHPRSRSILRVAQMQDSDGFLRIDAFPRDNYYCQGWNTERCLDVVDQRFPNAKHADERIRFTLCVMVKVLGGYGRELYHISTTWNRALEAMEKHLGYSRQEILSELKTAKYDLWKTPARGQLGNDVYERTTRGWVAESSRLMAPMMLAEQLEAQYRSRRTPR